MATINIIPAQPAPQQIQLIQEDISDQLGNSTIVFFTSQSFLVNTLQVFLNGLNLRLGSDFSEISSQSFRFINYTNDFLRTVNSTNTTLAVKYFVSSGPAPAMAASAPPPPPNNPSSGVYEDDLSGQLFPGISTFYFNNNFQQNTLAVISNGFILQKDVDYIENGTDSIIITNIKAITNNNLIAKYIIS